MKAFAGVDVAAHRVAVTPEQVRSYNLIGQPPKHDKRWPDWPGLAYQAEALDPRDLADIVRSAIEHHLDLERVSSVLDQEAQDREWLREQAELLG